MPGKVAPSTLAAGGCLPLRPVPECRPRQHRAAQPPRPPQQQPQRPAGPGAPPSAAAGALHRPPCARQRLPAQRGPPQTAGPAGRRASRGDKSRSQLWPGAWLAQEGAGRFATPCCPPSLQQMPLRAAEGSSAGAAARLGQVSPPTWEAATAATAASMAVSRSITAALTSCMHTACRAVGTGRGWEAGAPAAPPSGACGQGSNRVSGCRNNGKARPWIWPTARRARGPPEGKGRPL